MKPWFEKELAEADIIKFPVPQAKVIQMPNVQEYPDFITGVQDLQAKQKDGTISQESYDKLYAELIHRFMKKESFETPWYLKEAPPQAGAINPDAWKQSAGGIMDLPQAKEKLNYIMGYLKDNPKEMGRFHKMIKQKEREEKVSSGDADPDDLVNKLSPHFTAPEKDHVPLVKYFIDKMVHAKGDNDDMINFINNYGKVSYINTKIVKSAGQRQNIRSWLGGNSKIKVSDEFIRSLFTNLFPRDSYGGPGETAMALLSPNITRPDNNKGDLIIDGDKVEVKSEMAKGGGRLKDENTSFGTPNIEPIYDNVYASNNWPKGKDGKPEILPAVDRISASATGRKYANKFQLLDVAKKIDQVDNKLADAFLKEMLTSAFTKVAGMYDKLFANWRGFGYAQMNYAASKMSYLNYKTELDKKGFNHILLLNLPKRESLYFNTDNFDESIKLFSLGSVDWGDKMYGPAAQASLKQ